VIELARADLLGRILVRLLQSVDFGRLEEAHQADLRQLCVERIEATASPAITRQLGGRQAVAKLGGELGETLVQCRQFLSLLQADDVSEVFVSGQDRVWVEQGDRRLETGIAFPSHEIVLTLARWLTAGAGRQAWEQDPVVDVRLPDGSLVSVVVPPVAVDGAVISVRRPRHLGLDLGQLAAAGTFPVTLVPLLSAMVGAHLNLVVSGLPGTGRTTMLNALCKAIDPGERVVAVEQLSELRPGTPRLVRLEAGGEKQVPMTDLLATAVRMRPDRLVVGELRGCESWPLLEAMASGFHGSMATLRGSSPREAIERLETMVATADSSPTELVVRRQIGRSLDLIVHLRRLSDGRRAVGSIVEIGRNQAGITLQELFRFHEHGVAKDGRSVGTFAATGVKPALLDRLERSGFKVSPELWQLQTGVA
jgi:pilus assembly protein CpaF